MVITLQAALLTLALSGCGQDDGFAPPAGPDPGPVPVPINDLRVLSASLESVQLTWTAPYVPEDSLAAGAYEIRFWDRPLAYWTDGALVDSMPAPRAPGERDTLLIGGLNPSTVYSFGIKSANASGFWSPTSNIAEAMTGLMNETWLREFGDDNNEGTTDLVALAGGDYFMVGSLFTPDHELGDVLVTKVDQDGEEIWRQTYGGPSSDYGSSAVATEDGGCVIVGSTRSFGAGHVDVYLLRIDAAGTLVWQRGIGTAEKDIGGSICADPDGGFMVGGRTWGYDPVIAGFLIKVDAAGEVQWSRAVEGTSGISAMAPAGNGDWILAGQGGVYLDIFIGTSPCITRVDAAGTVLWQRSEGHGLEGNLGTVIDMEDGSFLVTGSYGEGHGLGILISGFGEHVWEEANDWPLGSLTIDTDGGFLFLHSYTGFFGGGSTELVKLNPARETVWESRPNIEDSFRVMGSAIVPHPEGGYLLAGTRTPSEGDDRDIFLMRVDGRGHLRQEP